MFLKYRLISILLFISTSLQAATLNIVDGHLMGAYNVNVNGTLYDVSFQDGSCVNLFNNCSDFTFNSIQAAWDASTSLMNQVFLGDFDTTPSLSNGIESSEGAFHTAYASAENSVDVSLFYNRDNSGQPDQVYALSFYSYLDLTTQEDATWAVWSPTVVPVPAAGWLLSSGLVGLLCLKRKKTSI